MDSRPGEVDAPLEYAAELAARTGEINAYRLGFGPQEVGQWRARALLETGDHELVVRVAEGLRPQTHLLRSRQADYWVTYGRALARTRGRHDDAVMAFRRAEMISSHRVLRDPFVRDVLAVLLRHSRQGSSTDQELRGMARRAGPARVAHGPTGMSLLRDSCGPVSPEASRLRDNPLSSSGHGR